MPILPHYYSDDIVCKRVALLGPLPPPLGGVAVHVERVIVKLRSQSNKVYQSNTVVEYRYRFLYWYLLILALRLLWWRPHVVFYHTIYLTNSVGELWLLVWLKKLLGYQLLLVEHDCRHLYKRNNRFKKNLQAIMQHIDRFVFIGNITKQSYDDNCITMPGQTSCESAFLPPPLHQVQRDSYPQALHQFLASHTPRIMANAYQLVLLEGKDLYGIHDCLHLLVALKKEYTDVGLCIVLAQTGNEDYLATLEAFISDHELTNHIYILRGNYLLWPLLKQATLFVRPTLSDGASVSVQEALYCGVPTVASDACERPLETVLFTKGDTIDFIAKVQQTLTDLKK